MHLYKRSIQITFAARISMQTKIILTNLTKQIVIYHDCYVNAFPVDNTDDIGILNKKFKVFEKISGIKFYIRI